MKNLVILFLFITAISYGQSKCYLDYHMKKGFEVKQFCWGSDSEKFKNVLSKEALSFMDSVFIEMGINPNNITCKKLTLKDGDKILKGDVLSKNKYFYTVFERTFDCFDYWSFKNYKGKLRIDTDTKVLLEYSKGVKEDFEMLKVYIMNAKKTRLLL